MTPPPRNPAPGTETGSSALRSGPLSRRQKQLHAAAAQGITPQREALHTVTTVPGPPAPPGCGRAPDASSGRGPVPVAEPKGGHGGGRTVENREPGADGPPRADLAPRRQRRRLALAGVPGHVAKGRAFTRQALRDWGWGETETSEDTLLLVSELLTNASLHAHGCHELVLTADETALRIEVHDGTTALPVRHPAPRPGIPGGRGLYIVERLSDRWGTHAYESGKAVWAEVEASRLEHGMTVQH